MRAGVYLLSAIAAAGILSAGVSVAAVLLMAPAPPGAVPAATAAVETKAPAAAGPAVAAPAAQSTPPAALPAPPIPGQEEQTALEFLRRAGAGDTAGALALSKGLTEEALRYQAGRYAAVPRRATRLPGPAASPLTLMLWADYRLEGLPAKGQYMVTMQNGKVTALKGPLSPEKGFQPFTTPMIDEQGNPVQLVNYLGRGLLLVTPRTPEPGLAELLASLHATYASRGVEVVLATDIRSPDWVAAARKAGFTGQVWRVKLRMEEVPLVSRGTLLGAFGVLVDRSGFAVGSLGALDPLGYNLPDKTVADIVPAVFQAYGLLP